MKIKLMIHAGVIIVIFFLMISCSRKQTVIPLTELDLSKMEQGYGRPHIDLSVTNNPLSIAGKTFATGVGTHASSRIDIDLGRKPARFTAFTGIDDAALNRRGSVNFVISGDDKTLWESGTMSPGDAAKHVDIELNKVKILSLIVRDAGDGIDYDHADWAEASFTTTEKIKATGPREVITEPKIILTPKPGIQPRINGAKIFGVRPGSAFLFTIPATGEKPLKYEVLNLPEGLVCNAATGQITGVIKEPGDYLATFRVTNKSGSAERQFKIVCGSELALTPHMGWNSWYVWENHVTDSIMRKAAAAMVSSGMIDHGYMYVNIDDCWSIKQTSKDSSLLGEPRDKNGMINSNKRFPDMKSMTDYIHSLGLKAGIYTSPGPRTCAGHVAAYQFEENDIQRFVEWGFDFLKYDWCTYNRIAMNDSLSELQKPYILISEILKKQNRDIVLNLCQYGLGDVWKWGKSVGGNSWRTAGDLGGSFEGIGTALFRDGFDVFTDNELQKYGGPGGWNDPDYLLIGYLSNWEGGTAPSPLTPNEQYTQISLWCLQAAPLIFSGDITRLDDFTLSLLTNDEVIEVDQDPLGKPGSRIIKNGDLEIWMKKMEDGSSAIGLFNRGNKEIKMNVNWSDLGISGKQKVRDLWRQKDLGTYKEKFSSRVARHGVEMIRVWPAK
ncbi:MAG: NPCBM/NEW2 domain-containing protein [Bacteroidia bacterium]|nr:NPCBM/NEW2 domain-containing protein [Bacteroidia bacterium]